MSHLDKILNDAIKGIDYREKKVTDSRVKEIICITIKTQSQWNTTSFILRVTAQ